MVKPTCLTNIQISVSGDIGTKVASKGKALKFMDTIMLVKWFYAY
jgi:hypothetical protein